MKNFCIFRTDEAKNVYDLEKFSKDDISLKIEEIEEKFGRHNVKMTVKRYKTVLCIVRPEKPSVKMVICSLDYLITNFNLQPDYKDEKEGAMTINEIDDVV